jgi:hypothetical protein
VQRNWFMVDQHNMEFTRKMFEQIEFVVPQPRCFEEMLTSFEV